MKISFLATFALLAVVGAAYGADIDEELVSSENSENVRRLGKCKYDYPVKGKDGTCWKVEYCDTNGTWKKTNSWPEPKKDCYPSSSSSSSSSSSTSSSSSSSSSSKSKDCKDWKKKYKRCKKKNKTKKCKKKSYYKKWKRHCD